MISSPLVAIAAPRASVSSSKLIEIQSNEQSFFIHTGILSVQPEPLRCFTGDKIDLSDWDSNTVRLFVEFLYNGNYTLYPKLDDVGSGENSGGGQDDIADKKQSEPTGADMLAHAKLYVLAQCKNLELQKMALERLEVTLCRIEWSALDGPSIVGLFEFLEYTNSKMVVDEPMHVLVLSSAVDNVERLVGRKEMTLLLNKGGPSSVRLMEMVMERLSDVMNREDKRLYEMEMEMEIQDWKKRAASSEEQLEYWKNHAADLERKVHKLKENVE